MLQKGRRLNNAARSQGGSLAGLEATILSANTLSLIGVTQRHAAGVPPAEPQPQTVWSFLRRLRAAALTSPPQPIAWQLGAAGSLSNDGEPTNIAAGRNESASLAAG